MECILEFNFMQGYWLNIRNFTERVNALYGTTFAFSTMQKYTKQMDSVLRHSFVKPLLQENHKNRRLEFVLNRLEYVGNGEYRIKDMNNHVHIDEKWFYVTREDRKIVSSLKKSVIQTKQHHTSLILKK
jgi:hypothetical protein